MVTHLYLQACDLAAERVRNNFWTYLRLHTIQVRKILTFIIDNKTTTRLEIFDTFQLQQRVCQKQCLQCDI